jgi:hypothetical protein
MWMMQDGVDRRRLLGLASVAVAMLSTQAARAAVGAQAEPGDSDLPPLGPRRALGGAAGRDLMMPIDLDHRFAA